MPNASLPCSVGPSNQPLGPEAANDDAGRHGEEIPRPDDSSRQTDPKHKRRRRPTRRGNPAARRLIKTD